MCSMALFEFYIKFPIGGHDNLSTFWLSYMDMIGDFAGTHPIIQRRRLAATPAMAYDILNYVRYLPYYYAQMSLLPTTDPDVHAEFMQGGFSVQLGPNNPFGRIPVDQTIYTSSFCLSLLGI